MRGLTSLMLGIALCAPSPRASSDEGQPASKTEFSAGYQFLRSPQAFSGWNASFSQSFGNKGFSWVVEGGGLYVEGDAAHLLMTGPRLSHRVGKEARLFAQVLAGAAMGGDDGIMLALPGAGVDFRPENALGFRVQVDWPMLTQYGVFTELPRFSTGIVLRPGRR